MASRPNILLITSDQQRGDCYGFEGRNIRTPHLDRLAGDGTRFPACITPNPVCQPARASILTGLLPLTHGVHDNGIDLLPEVGARGFAGQLSAAGYHTALLGKAHFATAHTFQPTGTPECRRSMQNYGPDWYGPYMGFDHVELMVEGHNQWPPLQSPSGQHYERWYYGDGYGEEKNRLHALHLPPETGAAQTWHSALPPAWHNSTWVGDRTIDYLRRHQNEPFCVWASFPDPHHPFDCPEPWSRLHDPDAVELPPHHTLDLERRPGRGVKALARKAVGEKRHEFGRWRLHHVLLVYPHQLCRIETRRRPADMIEVEVPDQLVQRENFLITMRPPEPRQVVEHRAGQETHLPILEHVDGAVALRELRAIRPVDHRQMRIPGHFGP